jgi:hypothetical protein
MPRAVSLACARIRMMSADTVVRRNPPSALIPSQLIALFDSTLRLEPRSMTA